MYKPEFKKVPSKETICFLEAEIPEYVIVIKSSHYHPNGEDIYYVIEEDPFEPGNMNYMTAKEIIEKYDLENHNQEIVKL